MPTDDGPDLVRDMKAQHDYLGALAVIVSFPVEIFTTRLGTWGERYVTFLQAVGCLWPPVFAALYGPHARLDDVFAVWLLSLALLAAHQGAGAARRRRGEGSHSRFWGASWLQRGEGLAAQRQARRADVVLTSLAGVAAAGAGGAPLGAMLLVGAAGKLVADGLAFQAAAARLRQMEDLRIENEFYAEEFRGRRP